MQKACYFTNEGQQIAGTIHIPEGPGPFPGVVLCHGFTGQRIEAHFLFVKMSRALEEAGIVSLRFDFRGSGESEGRFQDMTVVTEVSDARQALSVLSDRPEVDEGLVGILGLSFGGFVAACVTGLEKRVRSTVLWSAVADLAESIGSRQTEEGLRSLKEKGYIDRGAHALGQGFFDAQDVFDSQELVAENPGPLLIVHGTEDEAVPVECADRYERSARREGRRVEKLIVDGADHTYTSLAWEATVIEQTRSWFTETL